MGTAPLDTTSTIQVDAERPLTQSHHRLRSWAAGAESAH